MACNPSLSFSLFTPYPHHTPRAIRFASAPPLKEWGHRFQDNFSWASPAAITANEFAQPGVAGAPGGHTW
jgi:hypothetical protein